MNNIQNLINELKSLLRENDKQFIVMRATAIREELLVLYRENKSLFDKDSIDLIKSLLWIFLKKKPKKGSGKGLGNNKSTFKELKNQEKARSKPYKSGGISVTATARKDLDLSMQKIFHKNDCKSLYEVPYGRGIIFENRDVAIKEGYRPCVVCRP